MVVGACAGSARNAARLTAVLNDHYTSFAAPVLCLLIGYGVGVLAADARTRTTFVAAAGGPYCWHWPSAPSGRSIRASGNRMSWLTSARADECTWSLTLAPLMCRRRRAPWVRDGCPVFVDHYAMLIDETDATDDRIGGVSPTARR